MAVYIVRHGQTEWNEEGRIQGHKNSPLTKIGQWVGDSIARKLDELLDENECRVFTSDLGRAVETTDIIVEKLYDVKKILKTPALRERCYGEVEGNTYTVEDPMPKGEDYPGGESYDDVANRLDGFFMEHVFSDMDTVVVSHQSTIRILLCLMLGEDWEDSDSGPRLRHNEIIVYEPGYDGFEIIEV